MRRAIAPFVCTTLARGEDAVEIVIEFSSKMTCQGARATYWQPAEPAEFRLDITEIWIDGDGDLLTDAETATLAQWFDSTGYDAACMAAEGHEIDREMTRGCEAYHRQRDEGFC